MGKLHSLRRAIKRNPDKWEDRRKWRVNGAEFCNGEWVQARWYGERSYRAFINKTLDELNVGRGG